MRSFTQITQIFQADRTTLPKRESRYLSFFLKITRMTGRSGFLTRRCLMIIRHQTMVIDSGFSHQKRFMISHLILSTGRRVDKSRRLSQEPAPDRTGCYTFA